MMTFFFFSPRLNVCFIQIQWPEAQAANFAGDFAPECLPAPPSQECAPTDGTSELILYVKMGLVFGLEVQVGAAILDDDILDPSNYLALKSDLLLDFLPC